MILQIPDTHPGRCPNFRGMMHWMFEARRCLRMAEHPGACRFPDPVRINCHALSGGTYVPPIPAPWVEPAE